MKTSRSRREFLEEFLLALEWKASTRNGDLPLKLAFLRFTSAKHRAKGTGFLSFCFPLESPYDSTMFVATQGFDTMSFEPVSEKMREATRDKDVLLLDLDPDDRVAILERLSSKPFYFWHDVGHEKTPGLGRTYVDSPEKLVMQWILLGQPKYAKDGSACQASSGTSDPKP